MNRSQTKKARTGIEEISRHVRRFMDLEAVDSGSEDDGQDEDDLQDPPDELEDGEEGERVSHSRLTRHLAEQDEAAWDDLLTRARQLTDVRRQVHQDEDDFTIRGADALWEIGCLAGSEEVAVFRIFQRSIPDAPNSRAKAVFGRCTLPGRIFVEAATLQEARRVILGIPELNASQITAVERELWMRLLQPQGSAFRPQKEGWVRLRGCRRIGSEYKNDIAFVCSVDNSGHLEILVIPRISLLNTKKRTRHYPPPAPLSAHQIQEILQQDTDQDPNIDVLRFKNQTFTRDGFKIFNNIDLDSYLPVKSIPSLDELSVFARSRRVSPQVCHHLRSLIASNHIKPGDRVKLLSGEFRDLPGTITEVFEESINVKLPSQDIIIETTIRNVRLEFRVGDQVSVTTGEHVGLKGWVTQVDSATVTICDVSRFKEITALANCIEFYSVPHMTTLRPRAPDFADAGIMRDNPNKVYHKKCVIVTGKHLYKGYRGIILDTTPSGQAKVELAVIPPRVIMFELNVLCIWREGIQERLLSSHPQVPCNSLDVTPSPFIQPTAPQPYAETPMPEHDEYMAASPTWNPSALSPSQDSLAWLSDPAFSKIRIKLAEISPTPGVQISAGTLEFIQVLGDSVRVRDGMIRRTIPFSNLKTFRPTGPRDLVVPISGEDKGKVYKVRTCEGGDCTVREEGRRLKKNEKDKSFPTALLAQVFPPI